VIEKSSGKVVMKYYSESIFHFHHINAYEDDNHIVSDIITYDDSSILEKWSLDKMRNNEWDTNSPPIPRRYVIPLPTDRKVTFIAII
jgi:carotenoid cleavage dioxygenase-like enzyme